MNHCHTNTFVVRTISHSQLARLYGVSNFVLHTWMKSFTTTIGRQKGQRYSPEQLLVIFDQLGLPSSIAKQ